MKQGLQLRQQLAILFAVILAVFALESNYLNIGFFLDDFEFIELLKNSSFADNFSPYKKYFYRPVFLTWFWAFLHTAGPNPFLMHAGNLVLFGIVIYLLGLLVYRVSRSAGLAVLAGVLFWLWPGKTQAVWWISCSSTLLAALFFVATLICWHGYRTQGGRAWYCGALACFLLSLGSKEDAHSLPLVLLLFDLYVLKMPFFARREAARDTVGAAVARPAAGSLPLYLPFVAGLAIYLYLDVITLLHSAFVQSYIVPGNNRLLTALRFTHSLWPFATLRLAQPEAYLWIVVLIGSGIALCRSNRHTLFLLVWFLLLTFLIGVEASPSTLGSTRFAFLPAMPASVLAAIALRRLWRARDRAPLLCCAVTAAVLVAFNPFRLPTFGGPVAVATALCVAAAALLLWRRRLICREAALPAVAVMGLAAAFYAFTNYGTMPLPKALFPTASLLAGMGIMSLCNRRQWWHGAIGGLLLWQAPIYSVAYFLTLAAMRPALAALVAALRARWEHERQEAAARKLPLQDAATR